MQPNPFKAMEKAGFLTLSRTYTQRVAAFNVLFAFLPAPNKQKTSPNPNNLPHSDNQQNATTCSECIVFVLWMSTGSKRRLGLIAAPSPALHVESFKC